MQVVALRDRAAATAVVQRLTGKGYPAFLVNPAGRRAVQHLQSAGRPLRRSRRGRAGQTRLKKEEQFEPWISALALLSGALLALSFPNSAIPACAWMALTPLVVGARAAAVAPRARAARFFLGLLSGVVYFAGTLYWLVETMTTFGGLPTPLAVFAAGAARRVSRRSFPRRSR